eukprot:822494-Pelagomonas_calceolata.AAC.7
MRACVISLSVLPRSFAAPVVLWRGPALAEKAKAQSRDVTSDVVVEEVFENERFQPFRWVLVRPQQTVWGPAEGVRATDFGRTPGDSTRQLRA